LGNIQVKTGTRCSHISNNAPQHIADPNDELRKEGVRVAKIWMDAASVLGAKTMRVNTGVSGTRVMPEASARDSGYPRNDKIVVYLKQCIESFKELADYGGRVGVAISIENHWGLCANPMNIRIVIDEVNHPYCEATPDFCNWEHEYHLFHGLEILMPYTHHHVHAKYWDRWKTEDKDWNDVARSVRVLNAHKFTGTIALEYEHGPWNDIEGSMWLMKEVLAAL
jgi:sugar phosphate isomerase/epimerase